MTIGGGTKKQIAPSHCKYCGSEHVIKYGHYKGIQRYYCKDCRHKFVSADTIPRMWYTNRNPVDAVYMHYEGMSFTAIRRNLIRKDDNYISRASLYNWVQRFTQEVKREAEKYQPQVGEVWVATETVVRTGGGDLWLWDIIDTKTRFLLASHLVGTRTSRDARMLMERAYKCAGKYPEIVYADKLMVCLEGIERPDGAESEHTRGNAFDIRNNANFTEHFRSCLKGRAQAMRYLKSTKSAQEFLDGWLIHYNFFRPGMFAKGRTPAEISGIRLPPRRN